jgi:hypothetical protein
MLFQRRLQTLIFEDLVKKTANRLARCIFDCHAFAYLVGFLKIATTCCCWLAGLLLLLYVLTNVE